MNHKFQGAYENREICVICGYDDISHADHAQCEECGKVAKCDLFPDVKHPKKMLICPECRQKFYETAKAETDKRVLSYEVVKTSGDYFNSNIPAILEIKQAIEADASKPNKPYEIAEAIKLRLNHIKTTLIEKRNEVSTLENEQRETQIFLNHHMKLLSAEQQKQLGLLDITYKPSVTVSKGPKKAPTVKKFDKEELRKVANSFNIDITVLQMIVTRRQVTVEEAAKIYLAASNKVEAK